MLDLSLAINIGTRIGGFSPATLFAASEPGGWYDPSDLSTLYQDSAGTTPVTAPGQTVGLWLDKSKGLVLGADVAPALSTYVFSSGTTGTFVASGSNYQFTDTVGGVTRPGVQWPGGTTLSAAKFYQINFEVVAIVGATTLRIDQTSQERIVGVGTHSFITSGLGLGLRFRLEKVGTAINDGFTIGSVVVRELPGNHLTQSSLSNRAIYGVEPVGGRRNLELRTEDFGNAYWTKVGGSITATNVTAPNGTATGCTLTGNGTGAVGIQGGAVAIGTATQSWYVKAGTETKCEIWNSGSVSLARFDLSAVTATNTNGTGAFITAVGDGWFRIGVSSTSYGGITRLLLGHNGPTLSTSLNILGVQVEVGSTATAYQRVVTAFDVTEAGVPSLSYIQFDGSDDWLVSPTITPGIDKAQVFAGVRMLSNGTTTNCLVELSPSIASNAGGLAMFSPDGPVRRLWLNGGGNLTTATQPVTTPVTSVDTGVWDIAATNEVVLRVNGTQVAAASGTATGNFLAYPLYIGRRGGTSLPYNGRIYSLIVRFGANLDAATITQTENWVAGKTGITI